MWDGGYEGTVLGVLPPGQHKLGVASSGLWAVEVGMGLCVLGPIHPWLAALASGRVGVRSILSSPALLQPGQA